MPPGPAFAQALWRLPLLLRLFLAGMGGAAAAWAMPPTAVPPALILQFAPLFLLLAGARGVRAGFLLAWASAFGFHVVGLSWVGEAFLVEADKFGWMEPIVIAGLPAGLAILPGLAGAAFVRLRSGLAAVDLGLFAALWMVAEWLRGHILTGFPWNLPVQAWDRLSGVLQADAWIGPYALSLLTVLAAAAPALLALRRLRRAAAPMALALLPLVIAAAAGTWRLAQAPAAAPTVPGVTLRLVQPNIPQREKWLPEKRADHFLKHIRLSQGAAAAGVTHIVWPEAATPFLLMESPNAFEAVAALVPPGGALITGTPRRISGQGPSARYGNAVAVIGDDGAVAAVYDKHHLVPVGEYVPLRGWLPVERLAQGRGDFTAGPGPQTLPVPGAPPVSPLVCYEGIFPGAAAEAGNRPGWLLNVTNDAWFGASAGPYQHLAIARLRAIEEGLPLVRAANTGISAVIDPYGRIGRRLPLGESGAIDAPLPVALPAPLYTRLGDLPFAFAAAALVGLALRRRWRASQA